MIDAKDMAFCEDAIRHGSLSFHAASKVLPVHVRNPALALYAFCRLAVFLLLFLVFPNRFPYGKHDKTTTMLRHTTMKN